MRRAKIEEEVVVAEQLIHYDKLHLHPLYITVG